MASSNTTIIISAFIVGVAIVIGLAAVNLEKKSDYITVGGQSEVVISPDIAALYFTISSQGATAEAAQAADSASFEKIRLALKSQGVSDTNIETSHYYLNKRVDWSSDGPVEKGYELSHGLKISTPVGDAGKTITTAVKSGVNGVDRIEYIISREGQNAAVAKAMELASVSAQKKAQTVAEGLDTTLGRVLKVEEGGWWIVPSSEPAENVGDLPSEYAGNVISPQRMAVQTNVNVVFAIN